MCLTVLCAIMIDIGKWLSQAVETAGFWKLPGCDFGHIVCLSASASSSVNKDNNSTSMNEDNMRIIRVRISYSHAKCLRWVTAHIKHSVTNC